MGYENDYYHSLLCSGCGCGNGDFRDTTERIFGGILWGAYSPALCSRQICKRTMTMKQTIALALCGCLLATQIQAQPSTNTPPVISTPPTGNAEPNSALACGIMLLVVLAAGVLVIYVYSNTGKCSANHKLVLERDDFDGNWTPIATNCVLVSTNMLAAFGDLTTDPMHRYRVRDLGLCKP